MSDRPSGIIVTFYSYKGGTGRSMALANMAWILASNGKRVMVVDWDLEAPGLHRYLHPFLSDKDLKSSEGVIDFVIDFAAEAVTPLDRPDEKLPQDWYVRHANILRYATSLQWKSFRPPGTLDFVSAGQQGPSYATHVNSFNWQNFYDLHGGGRFMEAARERMKAEYDYVLIDSRTGVSDTSGICTVQLPDILVVCFTLNNQSIEGAAAVAGAVDAQRRDNTGNPGLRIFPVPTRVDQSEKDKLELAQELAREKFAPFLWHVDRARLGQYWGEVEIPYEAYYAYEEILATFRDKTKETRTVLASVERLTGYLTAADPDGPVTGLIPIPEDERQRVLSQFLRQRPARQTVAIGMPSASYMFYVSYARQDMTPHLHKFLNDLNQEVRMLTALPASSVGFFDQGDLEPDSSWPEQIRIAIQNSRLLVPILSPRYLSSEWCGKEFQVFLERRAAAAAAAQSEFRSVPTPIIPVLWVPPPFPMPKPVAEIEYALPESPEVYQREGLQQLLRLARFRDEYQLFLSAFAKALVIAAQQDVYAPAPPVRPIQEIPNAFAAPVPSPTQPVSLDSGPRFVKFAFLVGKRQEMAGMRESLDTYSDDQAALWRPFIPLTDKPVILLAQQITIEANLIYGEMPGDEALIARLREAESKNNIVVLLVDLWSLRLSRIADLLYQVDRFSFRNCAILVLRNGSDVETAKQRQMLEDMLRMTMANQVYLSPRNFRPAIDSAQEFSNELIQVLNEVRTRIIQFATVGKRTEGLPVTKPTISRPSAEA